MRPARTGNDWQTWLSAAEWRGDGEAALRTKLWWAAA
jgi:hypothetical protein